MEPIASEKKSVRVSIFNQSYNLVATGNPGDLEELAHIVDDLMCSIATRAGNIDSARIAVLASLHLADRLRTLERELAGLKQAVDNKTKKFSLMLDQVIDTSES